MEFDALLLEDAHISPSCDRPYKLSEVQQALVPRLGEKLQIQCVTDEKSLEPKEVLVQMIKQQDRQQMLRQKL
ncbi:hypothetical protein F7725_021215 [Dissostichus mawsoni]|uniref:Uncharacterized protein n=1 Tax=Dissostichus mawsoni TaxID=36200 RepID=A0A7J5YI67_DISMA|nr:hypothetical protein F7725_021215 [Dissostichus mawsoni]